MEHANYPTLRELLRQDVFSNSRVLSGGNTLDIPVAGVNLTDIPDYCDWISPHELLITNCYSIHDDEAALSAFIGCGKGIGRCMYQTLTLPGNDSGIHDLDGKRAELSPH